jgi:hypothetical protein
LSLIFGPPNQNPLNTSPLLHACHMSRALENSNLLLNKFEFTKFHAQVNILNYDYSLQQHNEPQRCNGW